MKTIGLLGGMSWESTLILHHHGAWLAVLNLLQIP